MTHKTFDVSLRHLDLSHHYLLEASAGTGKTFTIENIVVRLLIENTPIPLEKILLVTFTRAATRDLKSRIRENIVQAIKHLEKEVDLLTPDYLKAILEKGSVAAAQAKKLLQEALLSFDEAPIFTIHSFCQKVLSEYGFEANVYVAAQKEGENFSPSQHKRCIVDYLRKELRPERISKIQLKIVLKELRGIDKLVSELMHVTSKDLNVPSIPSYKEYFSLFHAALHRLKVDLHLSEEKILADFELLQEVCDQRGINKANAKKVVSSFAALFSKETCEYKDFDYLLDTGFQGFLKGWPKIEKLKNGRALPSLHYPTLISKDIEELQGIIEDALNPGKIFMQLGKDCQSYVRSFMESSLHFTFDDLVKGVQRGTQNPVFVSRIRERFKVALIDEFQDTDPIQWEIFNTLFLQSPLLQSNEHRLFLVGDPKQSIYSFRNADIYTYIHASSSFEDCWKATLNTNYRSRIDLVYALNALFHRERSPHFIYLPRLKKDVEVNPVQAGVKRESPFQDDRGSVHFFTVDVEEGVEDAEGDLLLPFIVQELQQLMKTLSLKQFAILVSDRYQAARVVEFLKRWNIPSVFQKRSLKLDSLVVRSFKEILQAVANPKDSSSLKIALGGPFLRWTHDQIKTLDVRLEDVIFEFYELGQVFLKDGFALFFRLIIEKVAEGLLREKEGIELYQDLLLLGERLAAQRIQSLDRLIHRLQEVENEPDDELWEGRVDPDAQAVQILTIHNSKGLEFDVVFALGLISKKDPHANIHMLHEELCEELDAEKMRQLYVALTRAKLRVYIPAIFKPLKKVKYGFSSPMELFTARFGYPPADSVETYERLTMSQGGHFRESLELLKTHAKITEEKINHLQFTLQKENDVPLQQLIEPLFVQVPKIKEKIHSFTTLSISQKHGSLEKPKDNDILPLGAVTGNLLHKILEEISFEKAACATCSEELVPLIAPYLKGSSYVPFEKQVAQIVYNALHMPLEYPSGKCSLARMNHSHMYKETEFIYSCDEKSQIVDETYLKGVIDLVFFHQGKYYILDWKSNWLGDSKEAYDKKGMQKAMEENSYFLQASIYKSALKKYLYLVEEKPFEELFGGTFYIFLRGLEESSGVYFIQPGGGHG